MKDGPFQLLNSMIQRDIKPETMMRTIRSLQAMFSPQSSTHLAKDICAYYTETKNYLLRYAGQTNSRFIIDKTNSLETLHEGEFGRGGILGTSGIGILLGIKLRGARVDEKLEMKLERINNGLNSIAAVIENPDLESMYYSS